METPETAESPSAAFVPEVSGNGSTANDLAQKHKGKRGRKALPRDESGEIIRPGNKTVKSNGLASSSQMDNQAVAPTPPVDIALVTESVKTLLITIDATVRESIYSTAKKVTDSEPMAKNLENRVALKEEETAMMAKLSANCCQQYNLAGQHASAVFLGVFIVGYVSKVAFVMRQLKAIAATIPKPRNEPAKLSSQAE